MNVLLIHTLVLALASHRIAAHEQSDSDLSTASRQGEMHLSGERGTACKSGRISGSAGGAHPITGIVEGCELGARARAGTAGQAGRSLHQDVSA